MPRNLDHVERFIRIVIGLWLGNLGFANPGFTWLEGTGAVQTTAVGAGLYLVASGLTGFCLLCLLRRRKPGER